MTLPLVRLKSLADRDADSTSIFQTSDMDRYVARPRTFKFVDMCLAEFVSNFKPVYKRALYNDDKSDDDDDEVKDIEINFKLLDEKGSITQRKKPCVIRYMRVSRLKDTALLESGPSLCTTQRDQCQTSRIPHISIILHVRQDNNSYRVHVRKRCCAAKHHQIRT